MKAQSRLDRAMACEKKMCRETLIFVQSVWGENDSEAESVSMEVRRLVEEFNY